MTIEDLYVATLGTERTAWSEVGTTPFLDAQDQPTNYIYSTTKKAEHGDFTFDTSSGSGTINSVYLYVYGQEASNNALTEFYIFNGNAWSETDSVDLPLTWGLASVDISTILDSWTKIDAAKLYIKKGNNSVRIDIDTAYLKVDYTAVSTDGEDVKSASTRIALTSEDTVSASTRVAYVSEDTKSASTRIKRQSEDIKSASTRIKVPTEDVKSASTRIAYTSEDTKSASTRIAYVSEDVKSASTRVAYTNEDTKSASTRIKRIAEDVKSASTRVAYISEDVKSASTRVVVYEIAGVTKDKDGNTKASCKCFLFKDNLDDTLTFIGYTISDGSGNYSFKGIHDNDAQYLVYSFKDDTPHVFDVTDHVLQPTAV